MKIANYFNLFGWKKSDYSEFYIATLFAFFLFQLLRGPIQMLATWIKSSLDVLINVNINNTGNQWLFLVGLCVLLTLMIRMLLIEPLGLNIKNESQSGWETFLTAFFVFGFFIYTINLNFTQPMDSKWPDLFIKLTYGWPNLYGNISMKGSEMTFLQIVPWLWIVGPMVCFYIPHTRGSKKEEKKAAAA